MHTIKINLIGFVVICLAVTRVYSQRDTLVIGRDSLRAYNSLLTAYEKGDPNYDSLPFIVAVANLEKQKTIAARATKTYIDHLFEKGDKWLLSKTNVQFMAVNLAGTQNRAFRLFYDRGAEVDSAIKSPGFSKRVVLAGITREEIEPAVSGGRPLSTSDWMGLQRRISRKYNPFLAGEVVLMARMRWTAQHKAWPEYCDLLVQRVDSFGPFGLFDELSFRLNFDAWTLFLYSQKPEQLHKALMWSDSAIHISPGANAEYLDTYSNLLYKLGLKEQAVFLETIATKIDPQAQDVTESLSKMRQGLPTWPKM